MQNEKISIMDILQCAKELIAKNRINEALAELKEFFHDIDNKLINSIIVQQSKLKRSADDLNNNLISALEADRIQTQVIIATLGIIDEANEMNLQNKVKNNINNKLEPNDIKASLDIIELHLKKIKKGL